MDMSSTCSILDESRRDAKMMLISSILKCNVCSGQEFGSSLETTESPLGRKGIKRKTRRKNIQHFLTPLCTYTYYHTHIYNVSIRGLRGSRVVLSFVSYLIQHALP